MPTTLQARPTGRLGRIGHCVRTGNWSGTRISGFKSGDWLAAARRGFEHVAHTGGMWHLWGHSWEIEEHGLWDDLAELLAFVGGRDSVQYLPNGVLMEMVAGANAGSERPDWGTG
jgi:hypothetical protein